MNIALCYDRVLPHRGGCETYIADLIRRLILDRHEVHLFGYERDAASLPSGLIFHALMPHGGPRFLRPWRFAAACAHAVRGETHDLIIGFGKTWHQDVVLPQGGLHVASAEHNLRKYQYAPVRLLARIGKWIDIGAWSHSWFDRRQYLGQYQPLIAVSSRMVQEHFRRYYGISADRVRVVPNAVDPKRFVEKDRLRLRSEMRERLGIGPEEPVGLFVGHNYRLKGLIPLLRAVREMDASPFRLAVCGSSGVRRFKRLARRLGIKQRVGFLGYCPDVRAAFFAADFLVHPTFYDPCSLVVLEALACGLPVITTRFNGAAELLNPPVDSQIIDDPHDHRALANALSYFCDPVRRAEASRAARKRAESWTFEDHYRALLQVFQEVARRRQAA